MSELVPFEWFVLIGILLAVTVGSFAFFNRSVAKAVLILTTFTYMGKQEEREVLTKEVSPKKFLVERARQRLESMKESKEYADFLSKRRDFEEVKMKKEVLERLKPKSVMERLDALSGVEKPDVEMEIPEKLHLAERARARTKEVLSILEEEYEVGALSEEVYEEMKEKIGRVKEGISYKKSEKLTEKLLESLQKGYKKGSISPDVYEEVYEALKRR
jgi:uncharacterized protein Veg